MTQTPPSYLDDVPFKISEKYEPPPEISVPDSIYQRMNLEDKLDPELDYDFSLERNILSKIEEWKKVSNMERENLHERIRRREIEILRENEEKQKQLLTAVSYPSTDDLSSSESDEEQPATGSGETGAITATINNIQNHTIVQFSPSHQNFNTILTPTIVPEALNPIDYSKNTKPHMNKINYSDFENLTSSPFDNIELKTINDLDVLAQVLNITQKHSNKEDSNATEGENGQISKPTEDKKEQDSVQPQLNSNDINLNDNFKYNNLARTDECSYNNVVTTIDSVEGAVSISQTVAPNANHFYMHNTASIATTHNYTNMNSIARNDFYLYDSLPNNQNYLYNNYPINCERRTILDYRNYPNENPIDCSNDTIQEDVVNTYLASCTVTSSNNRNKSKSVPDILKELNDEIRDSEMRRNERRYRETEKHKDNTIIQKKINSKSDISDTFMKLSPSSQVLAKNISLMGFPLERVCKIAEMFGNDDKKIVEHLIPLSELLDLGFDESKISEALIKFDNNKEKALDFLIS